ncbi:MAG TPA: carboxymuconolactone decarboxylase family protein [Methanomicrobia archaeon]|nr:carboxymuconolactone decarboxylase family protein [Methanomicrobia archaeon]
MEDMKETLKEVNHSLNRLGKEYPEVLKAFSEFMGAVEKEGALSVKTKELIAVALSVVGKCKWCIAFHVNNALKAGATKNEIMEACFVAALMGGGPALMYVQLVVKALDQYSK